MFRKVDRDADGILNEEEFSELLHTMCADADNITEQFLNIIDPYTTNTITFTQICKLLSNYPEGAPILTRYLKKDSQW
jgi:Ca2+-binding EF-hand superfamily protein